MKTGKPIKAGIVQFDVNLGDIKANTETVFTKIERLGEQGTELVVLPEMWSCGFDNKNLSDHASRTPSIIDTLSVLALQYNIIITGSLPESSDKKIYNTLYIVDNKGFIASSYRKIHLFSLTNEDKYYSAGNQVMMCETSICPVGLMICYDLRFPELCRSLALKGAKVIIVSAQWPRVRISHWETLLKARAIENQLFIVAANRCGKDPDLDYGGRSQIVSPEGNIIAAAEDKTCLVTGELDLHEIDAFRKRIPCLKERIPHVYLDNK